MNKPDREIPNGIAIVRKPCNVEETGQPFGRRWRQQVVALSAEHLRALQEGEYVAVDVQDEYVVFLCLEGNKKPQRDG